MTESNAPKFTATQDNDFGVTSATETSPAENRPAFNFDDQQNHQSGQTSTANSLKSKAITRLQGEADNRKSMVSDQLKQVSGALATIGGGDAGSEAPQWLSSGVKQATSFIDRIADQVETRNTSELVDDVKTFAKANPALFLGACALAGFAAVRVFSAASDGR